MPAVPSAGGRGAAAGPAKGVRGPAAGEPAPAVSFGIGFTGIPIGRAGAVPVAGCLGAVAAGSFSGAVGVAVGAGDADTTGAGGLADATRVDRAAVGGAAGTATGGATGGAGGPPLCFSGGGKACTGGRSGTPPRAIGGAERLCGRLCRDSDPPAGRVDFGVWASGGGRSNSTVPRLGSDELADSVTPGAPNHTRILTDVSESTELEWVFGRSTPMSGNIARISPALTSSSRANSLIRIFDVRVKTALTP